MKVRNMLRGIPLMLLMVSVVGVFFGCKGSNSVPASYTVTFNSQGGSAVAAVKVEQGKKVMKPANPTKASFTFGGWYKEKECKTLWNFKSDIVTANITLYAKWNGNNSGNANNGNGDDNNGAITIRFDSAKMKCKRNGGVNILPNDRVNENERLGFEATPPAGKTVDKWTVNGIENDETSLSFSYKVQAADVQKGHITIGYTEKNTTQAKIVFDSSKMSCNNKTRGRQPVQSGDTVYTEDELDFDAKLSKGELIDKWLVNGEDKATSIAFHYTVKSEDIKNGTITVSYNTKQAAKATILFDANKMTCTKNKENVKSGDTVYEKDVLFFIATVSADKIIEWKVNAKEIKDKQPSNPQYLSYTITAEHNGQTIKVSYDEK